MIYVLSFLMGIGIALEVTSKNWNAVIWASATYIWILVAFLK